MFNLRITLSRYDGVMLRSEKIKHFVKIFVVLKCKKKKILNCLMKTYIFFPVSDLIVCSLREFEEFEVLLKKTLIIIIS